MELYQKISNIGQNKCKQYFIKQFVSSILSGCFLGFGACCSIRIGGHLDNTDLGFNRLISGFFGLPIGLLFIIICDTQLFTANTLFYTISLYEKKIKIGRIFISLVIIYVGNLIGSILFAYMIYGAKVLNRSPSIIILAQSKIYDNWFVALLKGIICNWFLCLALWQANYSDLIIDKAISIFFPITGFVSLGLDHCIVNMYIIPQAMLLGANITTLDFIWYNLIPVTIGNIISGTLLVGLTFSFLFH